MGKTFKYSVVLAIALSSFLSLAGEKIDKTLATDKDGRVSIDVMTGKVQIKTWDKNEVKVTGELDDEAEGYQFESQNGRVVFKVHMPHKRWGKWNFTGSELTFWIPANNDLRFEGVNVDVNAADIVGGSRINTVNGNIKASNLTKRVTLSTVNGEIESEDLTGRIQLSTVNGKINDTNSAGELSIEAVNGDIRTVSQSNEVAISNVNGDMELFLSVVKDLEISTVNGDLELDLDIADRAKIVLSSVGGDSKIKLDKNISARFSIETHAGGDITNNLTSDRVKKDKYGPGKSLRFETKSGSSDIEINTVNGDIRLIKK